jgi:hypothetical protein
MQRVGVSCAGVKDTPVAEVRRETYTPGDFPSAALKHYSTAARACGYREGRRQGAGRALSGTPPYGWRGFAAAALLL